MPQTESTAMDYEVLWGDGPLGLTLRADLGEDMPPVVGRITRMDSAAAQANVAVGHMLVSINGMETARQGYDHVVQLLQTIPRPATLRFRVPRPLAPNMASLASMGVSSQQLTTSASFRIPRELRNARGSTVSTASEPANGARSSKREQYTVVWTEGPLGMILRPDDEDCHVPCIRKITGKGAGTGMDRATVGDILVAVNGQETKSLGFRSTISLLKTIRKPAVLKFKRMHRRLSRKPSMPADGLTAEAGAPREIGIYDIVWREGDLGLKLKPGYRDVPVLSKLTGKGTASGLQNANVGDELVSVNGTLVEGTAYQDTLRMLKHSPKPAVLRFRPGKDRMSIMSAQSIRSNPATNREVERVRNRHVPIYDTGRSRMEQQQGPPMPHHHGGGVPVKPKKKRIPLDVAKELVAASLGIDLDHAVFAGMPILAIQEGTREAHHLRIEAKMCLQAQKNGEKRDGVPAKEALTRAETEAKMLQEALEKVKSQAKKYEEILSTQARDRVLASATRYQSSEIVGRQNNVIAELSGAIAGLKRDDYADVEVVPVDFNEEEKEMGILISDLTNVMSIPVVVPEAKYCADCGATDSESKLSADADGTNYCQDCWDKFLQVPGVEAPVVEEYSAPVEEYSAPPPAPKPVPTMDAYLPPPPPTPAPVPESEPLPPRPSSRAREKEIEEKNARLEAERKLMELKELRRSGSMRTMERQPSMINPVDRTRRDRRGLEELAQALKEEEERARAEGNLTLAKKLSAQRARMSPDTFVSPHAADDSHTGSEESTSPTAPKELSPPVLPPPVLARAVSADSVIPQPEPTPAPSNDYADVNSDEEADDQVVMSDTEEDVLREVEEKNFALARQLDEAHSVIERARMSIMMSGDDAGDDEGEESGLTLEQISLFQKLTSQADERASMVDRLHPQDDSDSDDSDRSELEDDDDEDDDGVWI